MGRFGHSRRVVARIEQPTVRVHVHRALDQDGHPVGHLEDRRHIRAVEPGPVVDVDVIAGVGGHHVALGDRRLSVRTQVRDRHLRGLGEGLVLEQVVQIEARFRRTLGEIPAQGGCREAGFGVTAVPLGVPGHGPVDDQRNVGLDHRGELGSSHAGHLFDAHGRAPGGRHADDVREGRAHGAEEPQERSGRDTRRVGEGDDHVEERGGGSFGEVPGVAAAGMRAVDRLLEVGSPIAIEVHCVTLPGGRGGMLMVSVVASRMHTWVGGTGTSSIRTRTPASKPLPRATTEAPVAEGLQAGDSASGGVALAPAAVRFPAASAFACVRPVRLLLLLS